MLDGSKDGNITLYAVNDTLADAEIAYTVTEMYESKRVKNCTVRAEANLSLAVYDVGVEENEQKFYLVEWTCDGIKHWNRFCTGLINTDYKKYLSAMGKCGFDKFEGFV